MATPVRELTMQEQQTLGQLLVETLAGEITEKTWDALYNLKDTPEPFGHLVSFAQGYALDAKSLARDLQNELKIVCMELLDLNDPPK